MIFLFFILFTQYCLICSFPCGHIPIFVSSKVWSIVCWSVPVTNIAEILLTWRKAAINQSKYVCAPSSCSTIISNKVNIRFSCHFRFLYITHLVFGYQYVEFELSITTICHNTFDTFHFILSTQILTYAFTLQSMPPMLPTIGKFQVCYALSNTRGCGC